MTLQNVDRRLLWILAFAAFLIFFRLSHVDMVGDDAHYSVRAVGLADFMFGDDYFQSTPLHWFEATPWWSHLSFHDHPILLFLIQHIFLSLHESIFFAKLPYALMGLGSIVLIFHVAKRLYGNDVGLLSAALLAVNAHWIWASRVSYMESGVIFFLLLAMYGYLRFLEHPARYWWLFGLTLGLALSTKFTTLFFLPMIGVHLALFHREMFRSKYLYGAVVLALVILSPTILYNMFMYETRGHFSLQFARLLGQRHPWRFGGILRSGYGRSLLMIAENLGKLISWPFIGAFGASLIATFFSWRKHAFFVLGVIFLTIQQVFIGQGGYVLVLYSIFIAIICAYGIHTLCSRLPRCRYASIIFAVYLIFFALNSHTLGRHYGVVGVFKSQATSDNFGVYQLDRFLDDLLVRDREIGDTFDIYHRIKKKDPSLQRYLVRGSSEDMRDERAHAVVVFYDNNLNWFSRVWLFERRRFYGNRAFIAVNEEHLIRDITVQRFYFVKATDAAPLDSVQYRTELSRELEVQIMNVGITPQHIYRDDGRVAFEVYTVPAEKILMTL